MSFCRITGRARNLPKPNFFPIIPPISPADARRLCRITGKRMDDHNYVPLIEVGKQPECVRCNVTGKVGKDGKVDGKIHLSTHDCRSDYKYVTPILKKEMMEKGDQRAFEDLQKLLKTLQKNVKPEDKDKMYVYLLSSALCGLIVPAEVEEAIKLGELETVSLSKSCDKAVFKIKGRPTLFIPLKEVSIKDTSKDSLFDGRGQNKDTLTKQKKVIEEKKRKTLANKKIFEDLERQADEDMLKDSERIKGKGRIFGAGRSQKAKQYRQKIADFREMYLPKGNMAIYGDWANAINLDIEQLDWEEIGRIKSTELDTPLPKKYKLEEELDSDDVKRQLKGKKRYRNVYIPEGPSLECVPSVEEVTLTKFQCSDTLKYYIQDSKEIHEDDYSSHSSLTSMFAPGKEDALKILPTMDEFLKAAKSFTTSNPDLTDGSLVKLGCIYDNGDGLKFCEDPDKAPKEANIVVGAIVKIPPIESDPTKQISRFVPGHMVGTLFTPGQKVASDNGEFIPAAAVRCVETGNLQFLPGIIAGEEEDEENPFIVGQFIQGENDLKFIRGQVVKTLKGSKFIEGETTVTADGLKFVAGTTILGPNGEEKFVSGLMVDVGGDKSVFVPGQLIGKGVSVDNAEDEEDGLEFIPGRMGTASNDDQCKVFVPGQNVDVADDMAEFQAGQMVMGPKKQLIFLRGEVMVNSKSQVQFVPGIQAEGNFVPGLVSEGKDGVGFVEGKLHRIKSASIFVPGTTNVFGENSSRFVKANSDGELSTHDYPEPGLIIDGTTLSTVFKKSKPKNGVTIRLKDGTTQFFPDGKIPEELQGYETVPGRMECDVDGPKFVPGKVMVINGIKTFIPGKVFKGENGEEVFVPGKMINGKNGPQFVPGQVIETEDGNEQFIPGQIMDTKDGKKFVPGQIIETKSGPNFIPGQVIRTDGGLKFVPGEMVEMSKGGNVVFVPGQVIDSPGGAKFVPGQVVETEEGPRLLPPDIRGDGDLEYCVQGFDINQEETRLILGSSPSCSDVSDLLGGIGDAVIGGEALIALAEGFESRKDNVIKVVGQGDDLNKILNDEMLDSCDNMQTRKTIRAIFLAVFAELCRRIDEILAAMQPFIDSYLTNNLDSTVMSNMKLYPALEALRKFCQEKNKDEPVEFDILNLVAGIITCSVPAALKECCADDAPMNEENFKAALLSNIGESIKGILEQEGIESKGLHEDIKDVVKLAKDLGFDENDSFFSKVAALTEGRANSVFMSSLLQKLKDGSGKNNSNFDMNDLLCQLIGVLSPRLHLQNGFREMTSSNPDFIHDVLLFLKTNDYGDISNLSAIDILHQAISKAAKSRCSNELNDVMHKVEKDNCALENNQDIRAMLEQAIGLARYMKKDQIEEMLFELLGDPVRMEAIRDDPIVRDVLDKIMLMQKLAAKDVKKRQKLEKLQRFSGSDDEEDSTLRELIHQCEALIREPTHKKRAKINPPELPKLKEGDDEGFKGGLKKSKSMIKKSKSMVMSAKDISMDAFHVMKGKADEKDKGWLQNFLTESLVEDVPWECSKALVILKQGYQAIIPREASRGILMGETSYTIIDDNGVEFFLSPKDKKARKDAGQDIPSDHKVKRSEDTSLDTMQYKPLANTVEDDNKFEDSTSLSNGLLANAKENIAEKKTSTSSTSSLPSARRVSRANKYGSKNIGGDDEEDEDYEIRGLGGEALAGFSSLEKYRPCNFEVGAAPKEMDDINDIRDYYTNLNTRSRAMQRVVSTGIEPSYGSNDYSSYSSYGRGRRGSTQMSGNRRYPMKYDDEEEMNSRKSSNQSSHQLVNDNQEGFNQPEEHQKSQMPTQMGMQPQQPAYPTYNSSGYQGGYEPDFFDRLDYGNTQQHQQQPPQQGPYGYMQQSYNNYQGGGGTSMAGYQSGGYPPSNPYNNNAGQNRGRYNNSGYNIAEMDPTTQLILSRARDVYNTTNYHMEDYNKQKDTERRAGGSNRPSFAGRGDDLHHLRPSPPKQQQAEEGSMMNSRTRSLLESLKQSTNALSDMTAEEDTPYKPSGGKSQGRQSRFLRKQESSDPVGKDYSPPRGVASLRQMEVPNGDYVSRLADDVLGESVYPPLDDNRRSNDIRRSNYESSYSTLPSRKSSAPYERNMSPPSLKDNFSSNTRNNHHDDEDIDAYINNLKQKTSGRDMVKVVSEIEGRRVTPPRMSRERDEGPSNDYGGSRQRRESGQGGRNNYSYNNDRGNDFSSYGNNDSSYSSRMRQDTDRQPTRFTLGNRRDMSTDRSARNRSASISRRGSFQADPSDYGSTMSSRNRYGKEEQNGMGPFGGTSGPQINSRKQPYLRNYSNSNYSSNE